MPMPALEHGQAFLIACQDNPKGLEQGVRRQDLLRRADSYHAACQQDYLVAKGRLFLDIMGGHYYGRPAANLVVDGPQTKVPAAGIQTRCWFIENQQIGLVRQDLR